jgi:hypothetical protein
MNDTTILETLAGVSSLAPLLLPGGVLWEVSPAE